jgi:hypothetical protein
MSTLEQTTTSRFPIFVASSFLIPRRTTLQHKSTKKSKKKRLLLRLWHRLRTPESKRLFNAVTQDLTDILNKNKSECNKIFLKSLTPEESTDFFLWKATKKPKQVRKHLHQSGHHKEPG